MQRLSDLTAKELRRQDALTVAQYLQVLRETEGRDHLAATWFLDRHPKHVHHDLIQQHVALQTKSASVGTIGGDSWASPLPDTLLASFIGLARDVSLLNRIPGLRKVPPNIKVPVVSAASSFYWVGEGTSKPFSEAAFTQVVLPLLKSVGGLIVSDDLLRAAPGTAVFLRDYLLAGLAAFIDMQFTDPAVAAVPLVAPASITNGITPIATSGNVDTDVTNLMVAFFANRPLAVAPVLVLPHAVASALGGVRRDGITTFEGNNFLAGIPTVITANVGTRVIMLDANAVVWCGDDRLGFDYSRNASVQVSDAPTSPPGAATIFRSLWHENLAALRVEFFGNWARADITAVQWLDIAATPA
jgi:hypothetical protein